METEPLTTERLHRLCGIEDLPKSKTRIHWQKVILKFIGAEYYVLGTKRAELSLTTRNGGFGLMFKDPVKFSASALLGKKIDQGRLYDVVIEFTDNPTLPDLSLAALSKGVYPRVLRNGDTVSIA